MPATTYSSTLSWSIYVATSFALLLVCSPILGGVRGYAYADAAKETAKGLVAVIDGLGPGEIVEFTFSSPANGGHVNLLGRSVVVAWGGTTATLPSNRVLPNATLAPGRLYFLELDGDRLEVAEDV